MNYPIYELKINESLNDESEVSYVALVDAPAIQKDFLAFNDQFIEPSKGEHETEFIPRCVKYVVDEGKSTEQAVAICYSIWEEHFKQDFEETYNDYPKAASENAKIALRYAEENGWGDCGTPVGKARANQLANGENISRETIARMASFDRHRENSDRPLGEGCGRLMWLAWGGDEGINWAQRKLKQIDSNFGGPGSGRHPENGDNTNTSKVDVKTENTGDGEYKYYVTDKDGNEIGKLDVSEVDEKVIIDNIFVDENSQKQGIASEMIDNVLKNYKGEYYSYYDSNDNLIKQPYQIQIGMTVSDAGQKLYNKIKTKIDDFNNSQMNLKLSKINFQIISEDEHIISGPLMIADELIYRNNDKFG
ncbi:MAG: N-acetyltransferase, partial [Flavobacteriaceae bacterium]|nr:N-acetyltransferase [Flavobacteriaceae bacterium]